jgi:hypothetical protein
MKRRFCQAMLPDFRESLPVSNDQKKLCSSTEAQPSLDGDYRL